MVYCKVSRLHIKVRDIISMGAIHPLGESAPLVGSSVGLGPVSVVGSSVIEVVTGSILVVDVEVDSTMLVSDADSMVIADAEVDSFMLMDVAEDSAMLVDDAAAVDVGITLDDSIELEDIAGEQDVVVTN
jgi:hypothetical protein